MECFCGLYPGCSMTLAEAKELAGVSPQFNVTALRLGCLRLESVRRTLTAAAAFGQLLSEMSSLGKLELIASGGNGGTVRRNQQNNAIFTRAYTLAFQRKG